jgi:hypothetical protein
VPNLRLLLTACLGALLLGPMPAPAASESGPALLHLEGWEQPWLGAPFDLRLQRTVAIRRDGQLAAVELRVVSPPQFGAPTVSSAGGKIPAAAWAQLRAALRSSAIGRARGACHLATGRASDYTFVLSWFGAEDRRSRVTVDNTATVACSQELGVVVTAVLAAAAAVEATGAP